MSDSIVSPVIPQLKRCPKCGELKPREAFSLQRVSPDGLQRQCKACARAYREANAKRRYEYNREWRVANNERITKYRATNAERIAEQKREYYAMNRERINERKREYDREYRAVNAKRINEYSRGYRQTDAGKAAGRSNHHNRRARKAGNGGCYTIAELDTIRAAQTDKHGQLRCWRCGKQIKGTPHLDHWIPLKQGGRNDAGNLHFMHWKCNLEKAAKMPGELGRLL